MNNSISREEQLHLLINTWNNLNGPYIIVLHGFSGIGKTFFIKDFYNHLSKNSKYWNSLDLQRDNLHKGLELIPTTNQNTEQSDLEWLWMATRCYDSGSIDGNADSIIFYEKIRHQFSFHLLELIKKIKKKSNNKKITKAAIAVLTHFALPGSSVFIEIINLIKDLYSGSSDMLDLAKNIHDRAEVKLKDYSSNFYFSEVKGLLQTTISLFNEIFKIDKSFKIVICFDDSQWIDEYSVQILKDLFDISTEKKWNILFLFSGWIDPLNLNHVGAFNKSYSEFVNWINENDKPSTTVALRELGKSEIINIIKGKLPNIQPHVTAFFTDRCKGDIDLLNDYIEELLQSPGWIDERGELVVSTDKLNVLPSKAVDMARVRLNTLPVKLKESLLWSSIQGITFDEKIIEQLLLIQNQDTEYSQSLTDSDKKYGIVKLIDHKILKQSGEFRRAAFYEACYSVFGRHPRLNEVKYQLMDIYFQLMTGDSWKDIEKDKKNLITQSYNQLCGYLNPKEKKYEDKRIEVLIDFSKNRLLAGDYFGTINILEALVNAQMTNELRCEIYQVLVQAYYFKGSLNEEYVTFEKWKDIASGQDFNFDILFSKYLRRVSQPLKSIKYAESALKKADSASKMIESNIELVKCLWSAGMIVEAKESLKEFEKKFPAPELQSFNQDINYHHTSCLVLHDHECNKQVVRHAKLCIDGYENSGDIQSEIISRVNLADALWGIGYTKGAEKVLSEACQMAEQHDLPHTVDIACICYANILNSLNKLSAANDYYQKGLALANKIGHDWDLIYGKIYYGIYRINAKLSLEPEYFLTLFRQARTANYKYLADLALAGQSVLAFNSKETVIIDSLNAEASSLTLPGSLIYYKAFLILSDLHSQSDLNHFVELLGKIEGTKLNKSFLENAINKILAENLPISAVNKYFIFRWINSYSSEIENSEETKLKTCDYKLCEARCCYDGVYLSGDEEKLITEIVSENPTFFNHLPKNYIVDGNWNGLAGRKTNIREHNYQSADFPEHFNSTRCVFAFEDGACSLQSFSSIHSNNPWAYKPDACKIHPLQVNNGEFFAPPTNKENDKYNLGVNYPGYVSYTPCGQNRADGNLWFNELESEISEYTKMFDF